MQNKNLKLKLGLCGLALTSFLAVNTHSVVHADTMQDSNANNNAITWDSDSDDSQVVKEQSQQQVAQAAQPKQSAAQSAPVQPVQKQTTVQSKQWQVAVSNVSSTPAQQNRAESSTVRQSSVQTSTVNRVNVQSQYDNQANANVKVSNVNSDAQMPVHTQIIAKLSNKAKTYAISIPTVWQDNTPLTYTGYDGEASLNSTNYNAFTEAGWLYNGQYYSNQDALDKVINRDSAKTAQVATVNPQYMMNGTEFLTDTGITYNNHRLGLLVIPKFTELKQWTEYENGDPSDVRYSNDGYLTPYTAGFLPALGPTEMEWDASAGEKVPDKNLNWHTTYSYTAVPIDMNTGQTISGVGIDGTATAKTDIQTFLSNQTGEYGGDSIITPFSDTTVTGGTVSSDQNLVSPYIKPFLDLINSGKISPYLPDINVDYYPVSGDHGGTQGIYNHYNTQDSELKGHGQNTTFHKFMDDTIIPYTENLLYLTLKTRQVNPQDSRAHKSATRVISVNLPDDPAVKDRYKGILNSNNQIVQTINFTRTGTENIADGAITWGKWSGPSSFPSVTLPDIPGYTITMN